MERQPEEQEQDTTSHGGLGGTWPKAAHQSPGDKAIRQQLTCDRAAMWGTAPQREGLSGRDLESLRRLLPGGEQNRRSSLLLPLPAFHLPPVLPNGRVYLGARWQGHLKMCSPVYWAEGVGMDGRTRCKSLAQKVVRLLNNGILCQTLKQCLSHPLERIRWEHLKLFVRRKKGNFFEDT